MKIAYLILAHRCPSQVLRLITRLNSKDSGFFIHIDKKINAGPFVKTFKNFSGHLVYIKRENTVWGRLGLVKATLNGLKEIVKARPKFDYIVLLSGQCYPIPHVKTIQGFFEHNYGKIFLNYWAVPSERWQGHGGLDRLQKYYFHFRYDREFPSDFHPPTLKSRIFRALMNFYFHKPRVYPSYLKPYGGWQWFNITWFAAKYILDFNNLHPDYLRYHRYTFAPDETFFNSILLNATHKNISDHIIDDSLRFIDWERKGTPVVLEQADYDRIIGSGQLFARKFDMNVDSNILDSLDRQAGEAMYQEMLHPIVTDGGDEAIIV